MSGKAAFPCIICKKPTEGREYFGVSGQRKLYFHGKCLIRRIEEKGLAATPVLKRDP